MSFFKKNQSILSKKIIRIVLFSAGLSFAVVMLIVCIFLLPLLKNQALTRANITAEHLKTQFSVIQSDMAEKADFIAYNLNLRELLNNYFKNPTEENKGKTSLYFETYMSGHSDIFFIVLEGAGYERIQSNFHGYRVNLDVLNSPSYRNLLTSNFSSYYSPIYKITDNTAVGRSDSDWTYYVSSYSKNYYNGSKKFTLTVFYNLSQDIREALTSASMNLDSFFILTHNNEIIFKPETEATILPDSDILRTLQNKGTAEASGGTFFYHYLDGYMWSILTFVSNQTLYGSFLNIFVIVTLFILLLSIMMILFIAPYIAKRMAPLKVLSDTMANYSIGKKNVESTVQTDDEINDMSNIFNMMVAKNNKYVNQIYLSERTEQQMKYSLLMSQINPHFIYNTMNIITALARQNNTGAVISVNQALLKMLQDRLKISDIKVFDTVSQEIAILKQYQIIMEYRYGNGVKVFYDIDEGVSETLIPKNLIQPLMENAYYHGLTDENGIMEGEIRISIHEMQDNIILEVSDNGTGMDPDTLLRLRRYDFSPSKSSGTHIGLENIYRRLTYLYNKENCIEFESMPGKGTAIRLFLPCIIPE